MSSYSLRVRGDGPTTTEKGPVADVELYRVTNLKGRIFGNEFF